MTNELKQQLSEQYLQQRSEELFNKVIKVSYWGMGLGIAYYALHYLAYLLR